MKISSIKKITVMVLTIALFSLISACSGQSPEAPVAEQLKFPNFEGGEGKIAFAAQASEDVMFDLYFINARNRKALSGDRKPAF